LHAAGDPDAVTTTNAQEALTSGGPRIIRLAVKLLF